MLVLPLYLREGREDWVTDMVTGVYSSVSHPLSPECGVYVRRRRHPRDRNRPCGTGTGHPIHRDEE